MPKLLENIDLLGLGKSWAVCTRQLLEGFIHRLAINTGKGQRLWIKGLSEHISHQLACQICNPSRFALQNKSNTESLRFATEKVLFVRQLSEDTAEQISALHPQRPETGDIYDTKKRSGLRRLER